MWTKTIQRNDCKQFHEIHLKSKKKDTELPYTNLYKQPTQLYIYINNIKGSM